MDDLDLVTSRRELGAGQLHDLATLGLDWDGEVVWQSERFNRYRTAIQNLAEQGLVYECYCSRREIHQAAQAPNAPIDGAYPGTCRDLTDDQRQRRSADRPPALRLRSPNTTVSFHDELVGPFEAVVDDVVLARNDGTPAYNLAVVVDDAAQGVQQVVRGDDLVSSTPRQIHLASALNVPIPSYAHVALALGPDGSRLAKRHGSVTLADLAAQGTTPNDVLQLLAHSLKLTAPGDHVTLDTLLRRFDPAQISREPWQVFG